MKQANKIFVRRQQGADRVPEGNDVLEIKSGTGIALLDGGDGNDIIVGGEGNNSLDGGKGNDQIQGKGDLDIINGGEGADNIDAGGGNDAITGGKGADYLRGGLGNDTYTVDIADFGTDLISDAQSGDAISFMGSNLGGATYNQDKMAWIGANDVEIRKLTLGTSTVLAINAAGDQQNTIYLHNWQSGQFGISLSGQDEPAERPTVTPATVESRSDNNYVDFIRNDAGDGGQGNDIVRGTAAQSVLSGGIGNDILDGRGGDDWLEGGEGIDIILTGEGKDVAYGGSGNDIIRGNADGSSAIAFDDQPMNDLYGRVRQAMPLKRVQGACRAA